MQVVADTHPARQRLLAGIPVIERRLDLNGISTPVLDAGRGHPVVLLHGPGEHAGKWVRLIPGLAATHRVIAPDLPGHGDSRVDGAITPDRVLQWLDTLIETTCPTPPTLVGQIVGGGIGARFAVDHGHRIARLVLSDSLALAPFEPTPEFGAALSEFLERPAKDTFDQLWRRCAFDLERLRAAMGDRWEAFESYTLERVLSAEVQAALHALMGQFGLPPIPPEDLARITVPTTLIWGRENLAVSVEVARGASARYGWPLHIIDASGDDPPLEQPERFLRALRVALSREGSVGASA